MQISVVIPTCNRKNRLLALLHCLHQSTWPLQEVIVVDAGDDPLSPEECDQFPALNILRIAGARSVCMQRNIGIRQAASPWVLLCDDDVELPANYLVQLMAHVSAHPEAGAVSGLWVEYHDGQWTGMHPERSLAGLASKWLFQHSVWGAIQVSGNNFLSRSIQNYYKRKGNHLSRAGWPVLTAFSGDYFITPVYSLGAALVKKSWLENVPFDEVLDKHGIGDNYGVAMGFPAAGIHVVNAALVFHHQEPLNRLQQPLAWYRRVLALDYFIRRKKTLPYVKRRWLVWSLTGHLLLFAYRGNKALLKASLFAILRIVFNRNPYWHSYKAGRKVTEPLLR